MRLSRKRSRELRARQQAADLELKEPSFPRLRRMTRKRSQALRERLAKLPPLKPAFPHVLRMTRQRKREQQELEELKREVKGGAAASLGSVYLLNGAGAAAASLNTFHDVPSYYDYMRSEREKILAHRLAEENLKRARDGTKSAVEDWKQAEQEVRDAQEGVAAAEKILDETQGNLSKTRIALKRAQDASEVSTQNAIASQQAVADFLPQVYAKQAEVEALRQTAEAREAEYLAFTNANMSVVGGAEGAAEVGGINQGLAALIEETWRSVDYAQNHLPYVQKVVDGAALPPETAATVSAEAAAATTAAAAVAEEAARYEAQMEAAATAADDAQAVLDGLEEYLDVLRDRQDAAESAEAEARDLVRDLTAEEQDYARDLAEAENALAETKTWLEGAQKWLAEAKTSLAQSMLDETEAEYNLAHFGEGRNYGLGMEYYAWSGSESGHQFYLPLEVAGEEQGWSWAVETGFVESANSRAEGDYSVSGLTDTTLVATVKNKHPVNEVSYKMAVNVPTGQKSVHEYANITDDLARFTSFGEGWNFIPEVDVTHHINEENSLTGRFSYAFRGDYDLRYDDNNITTEGTQHPSNLFKQEAEYLHAGEKRQFLAILGHQGSSSATDARGNDYQEGDEWNLKLFYNKNVNKHDSWRVYAAYAYELGTSSAQNSSPDHIIRQNYGLGWRHEIKPGESWWTGLSYMKARGMDYDYTSGQTAGNRSRWAFQLGYERRLSEASSLKIKLERYYLRDDGRDNGNGAYHGWGVAAMFYRSF
ncbi:MAG: hypothetical protein IJ849_03080 [Selenomonadaceae bacterium]|nr:hypothetical protein [Selenomonadaceae bacterium]